MKTLLIVYHSLTGGTRQMAEAAAAGAAAESGVAVRLLLCRFSDACMTKPSTRANSRRPKSAGARNRGVQGTSGAATYQRAMGI